MAGERVLVVDDDPEICDIIGIYLKNERMLPVIAIDYASAMDVIANDTIDLVLLDIMLPDIDGYELCLAIRKVSDTPIIFLSSKGEEIDKILALSTGGDDYVVKPFLPGELMARIKANIRRSRLTRKDKTIAQIIESHNLRIDLGAHETSIDGEPVNLSSKEFDMLVLLARNPNRVFTPEQLLQLIWKDDSYDYDTGTVTVHISRLRKKIEKDHASPEYIITVKGVGYKFKSN